MKKQHLLIGGILVAIAALVWVFFGTQSTESLPAFKSESEARAFLKEQVADGRFSELEARVHLAEALSQIKKQERRQGWWKEYEEDIRQLMEKNGIGEDEAKELLKRSMKGKKKPAASKKGSGKTAKDKAAGRAGK
ncbi:hypothetical protein N8611_00270 [bacterium]|jgi:hypothetical protein|nr:hypothetical protein [bacterium]